MFGSLAKLAAGGMGPEQLGSVLKLAGIDVQMESVEGGAAVRGEFSALASDASLGGAKLLRLRGTMRDGGKLHALLVVNS